MGRPRKRPALLDQIVATGDRRLFSRKYMNSKVIFEDELGDPLLELPLTNLSIGGLFLEGHVPIRLGAKTFLSFSLPTFAAPIRLVGEVVRLERTGKTALPKGIGVRFIEVPSDVRKQLEEWLGHAEE